MIFEMRANSKYQLGFPSTPGNEEGDESLTLMLSQYTPYVMVNDKPVKRYASADQPGDGDPEQDDVHLNSGIIILR